MIFSPNNLTWRGEYEKDENSRNGENQNRLEIINIKHSQTFLVMFRVTQNRLKINLGKIFRANLLEISVNLESNFLCSLSKSIHVFRLFHLEPFQM